MYDPPFTLVLGKEWILIESLLNESMKNHLEPYSAKVESTESLKQYYRRKSLPIL